MFENMNEQQAREEILKQVAAYCDKYHNVLPVQTGNNPSL